MLILWGIVWGRYVHTQVELSSFCSYHKAEVLPSTLEKRVTDPLV